MTFQIQNFARVSVSANEDIELIQQMNTTANPAYMYYADVKGCFRRYQYFSSTFTGTDKTVIVPNSGDTQSLIGGTYNTTDGVVHGYFDAIANDLNKYDLIDAYSAVDNFRITYQVTDISASSPKVTVTPLGNSGFLKLILPATSVHTLNATPVTIIPAMANAIVSLDKVTFSVAAGTAYAGGGTVGLTYNAVGGTAAITPVAATLLTDGTVKFVSGAVQAPTTAMIGQGIVLNNNTVQFTAGASPLVIYVNYSVYATV